MTQKIVPYGVVLPVIHHMETHPPDVFGLQKRLEKDGIPPGFPENIHGAPAVLFGQFRDILPAKKDPQLAEHMICRRNVRLLLEPSEIFKSRAFPARLFCIDRVQCLRGFIQFPAQHHFGRIDCLLRSVQNDPLLVRTGLPQ